MLVLDTLEMLATSDPMAELDDAAAQAATRLRTARAAGDHQQAAALAHWIDARLDQRLSFALPQLSRSANSDAPRRPL